MWRFYAASEMVFIFTPLYNNNIEAVLLNRLYRLKSVEAVNKTTSIAIYRTNHVFYSDFILGFLFLLIYVMQKKTNVLEIILPRMNGIMSCDLLQFFEGFAECLSTEIRG